MSFDDIDRSAAWRAFIENEPVLAYTLLFRPVALEERDSLPRGIVIPLGTYGVLVAGIINSERPTEADFGVVRAVAILACISLVTLDHERQLERYESKLETKTATFEQLTDPSVFS